MKHKKQNKFLLLVYEILSWMKPHTWFSLLVNWIDFWHVRHHQNFDATYEIKWEWRANSLSWAKSVRIGWQISFIKLHFLPSWISLYSPYLNYDFWNTKEVVPSNTETFLKRFKNTTKKRFRNMPFVLPGCTSVFEVDHWPWGSPPGASKD